MTILFKFASRSRPEKFFQCLDNIHIHCKSSNWNILASLDTDDASMNNDDVKYKLQNYPKVNPVWGKSKNKIDAINRDMQGGEFDILINTSDDMLFTEYGFDEIIKADMLRYFPDYDGVLHYNDGNQGKNCMTMSIMGIEYYKRFNYIYAPDYISLCSDMEAQEVAMRLKKYRYMGDEKILFRHKHPSFGLAAYDDQYRHTEDMAIRREDMATYERRKEHNFYLPQ